MDLFIKIAFQGLRVFFFHRIIIICGVFFITIYNHISSVSLLSEEIGFFFNCSFFPCYQRRKINQGVQQSNYNLGYIIMNWLQRKVKIKASHHDASRFLSKTSLKQVSLNKRYSLKTKALETLIQKKKVSSTWRRHIGRERRNARNIMLVRIQEQALDGKVRSEGACRGLRFKWQKWQKTEVFCLWLSFSQAQVAAQGYRQKKQHQKSWLWVK